MFSSTQPPMKFRSLLLLALSVCVGAFAEEAVKGDVSGKIETWGVAPGGAAVADALSAWSLHDVAGSVKVAMSGGQVTRVETFTWWNAPGDVYGQTRETIYVSGGQYTGWTEHYLRTKTVTTFSRTIIDGAIEQEIDPDGSGYIEWTVASSDNAPAESEDAGADEGKPLPEVDVSEEGTFDGLYDRRIEIKAHDDDEATLTLRDDGYLRITFGSLDQRVVTISQKAKLEGRGKGDLSYDPDEEESANPTPTPTPEPTAEPTAEPTPEDIGE